MKAYFELTAENLSKTSRPLDKIEVDTQKIKAELNQEQSTMYDQIVEQLGLKGKNLSESQEDAILLMAIGRESFKRRCKGKFASTLEDDYRFHKRIERSDIKGVGLLLEILELLEKSKQDELENRLFDFIVWLVIWFDYELHKMDDKFFGFHYTSIEELVTTYAQVLGFTTNAVSNSIERLKLRGAIVKSEGYLNLNFPYLCFNTADNKELEKKLRKGEWIKVQDGICFIPQPFATLYDYEEREE